MVFDLEREHYEASIGRKRALTGGVAGCDSFVGGFAWGLRGVCEAGDYLLLTWASGCIAERAPNVALKVCGMYAVGYWLKREAVDVGRIM